MSEVKKALDIFGSSVVNGARRNLAQKDKNSSKALSNSLAYDSKASKNSFEFSLSMEDYGEFIDAGVKGIGGSRKKPNAKGELAYKLKKVTNNKFKYKKGIQNKPSYKHFNGFTIRRGIAPRSKGGQFTKRRGLMEAISQSVWHTGLETTNFLKDPFDKYFKTLPEKVVEAYALEVEDLLEFSLKK